MNSIKIYSRNMNSLKVSPNIDGFKVVLIHKQFQISIWEYEQSISLMLQLFIRNFERSTERNEFQGKEAFSRIGQCLEDGYDHFIDGNFIFTAGNTYFVERTSTIGECKHFQDETQMVPFSSKSTFYSSRTINLVKFLFLQGGFSFSLLRGVLRMRILFFHLRIQDI